MESSIPIRKRVQGEVTTDDWFSQRMHLVEAAYPDTQV
jgi:hypothetical protein